jgi:hypothetical protein
VLDYWHRFVWFDAENVLRGVSRRFYFQQKGVEFAAGLAWHPDGGRLLISYGVDDSEAWIATVDAGDVRHALENTERLSSSVPETQRFANTRHAAASDALTPITSVPEQATGVPALVSGTTNAGFASGRLVSELGCHPDEPLAPNWVPHTEELDMTDREDLLTPKRRSKTSQTSPHSHKRHCPRCYNPESFPAHQA